jgi:hypothetical protein
MIHFSFGASADIDSGRGALERETREKQDGKQAKCEFFQSSVSYLNKAIHKLTYFRYNNQQFRTFFINNFNHCLSFAFFYNKKTVQT